MVQDIANVNGANTFVSEDKFHKITNGILLEKPFELACTT